MNQGELVNNGTTVGTSSVIVNQGATLAGTGQISPTAGVSVGGILAPGDAAGTPSVGTLTFTLSGTNHLTFQAGSTLNFDIDGSTSDSVAFSTLGDWLNGSGGNATLALNATNASLNNPYILFSNVSTSNFTFANITGTPGGDLATVTYNAGAHDYLLTLTAAPEPSTWAMLGLGAALLGWTARRRTFVS